MVAVITSCNNDVFEKFFTFVIYFSVDIQEFHTECLLITLFHHFCHHYSVLLFLLFSLILYYFYYSHQISFIVLLIAVTSAVFAVVKNRLRTSLTATETMHNQFVSSTNYLRCSHRQFPSFSTNQSRPKFEERVFP